MTDLSKKWRNLRTVLVRKRKSKKPKSGAGADEDDEAYMEDDSEARNMLEHMEFLEPYVCVRRSTSNMVYQPYFAVEYCFCFNSQTHTHITMKNIIVHITHCCIAKVMYDIGLVEWHNNINVYCHILLCHV